MNEKLEAALKGLPSLDPEAQWIAVEMAAHHGQARKAEGRSATVRSTVQAFAGHLASLVAERMGITLDRATLSALEATNAGAEALVRVDPDQVLDWYTRIDLAARAVMAAAQERARNPLPLPVPAYESYWPFGQEGGFCNPRKLQDLD